jgi:hypothetical protein
MPFYLVLDVTVPFVHSNPGRRFHVIEGSSRPAFSPTTEARRAGEREPKLNCGTVHFECQMSLVSFCIVKQKENPFHAIAIAIVILPSSKSPF